MDLYLKLKMGTIIRHRLLKVDHGPHELLRDGSQNLTYSPIMFFEISWFGRVDVFFQPTPKKKVTRC